MVSAFLFCYAYNLRAGSYLTLIFLKDIESIFLRAFIVI